ncbi:hypothetical protein EMCRGX_G011254 [Ephydatia muelleri]
MSGLTMKKSCTTVPIANLMPIVMKRAAVRKKNLKQAHVVMVMNEARVVVADKARVVVADKARVVVADKARVVVADKARVVVADKARVVVADKARVVVADKARVVVADKARVVVADKARVVVADKARVVVADKARVVVADEAQVVVATQHHADSERMLQTGRRATAFLSRCLPLLWKILDLSIQRESNRRAHIELGSSNLPALLKVYRDITLADVYAYLAVIITMGLVELPNEDDYWSTDTILAQGIVQNILPHNRFQQIKHCLMIANPTPAENESDRLAKVRPFLDLVQQISWARYNPQHQLSLDESQCKCGHHYSHISYRGETKKPISDYIKVYVSVS